MLILTLRTDKPDAEVGLFSDDEALTYITWEAHRKLADSLHQKIIEVLTSHNRSWNDIQAVLVYKGPGSFTGLRIGLSVANSLASAHDLPIAATGGKAWLQQGIKKLLEGSNDRSAIPEYGALPHITQPKK